MKNRQAETQPLVAVVFRELIADDSSFGDYLVRTVLLTALGQVRIGTIWENNRSRERLVFQRQEFLVDFREGGWRYNSFAQAAWKAEEPPYPQSLHPLKYERDQNPMIELSLGTDGKLVIPSLEFFSRCYGRSQELSRVLATYPWSGPSDPHSHLYAPLNRPETDGQWQVAIKGNGRLVTGDARILAFAKYDPDATNRLKEVYAQIEQAHDAGLQQGKNKLAHPKIGPWFKQPARLRVRGLAFDHEKSFLALDIIGCSIPESPPITLYRKTGEGWMTDSLDSTSDGCSPRRTHRTSLKGATDLPLTQNEEPDRSGPCATIHDPKFEELLPPSGERQQVVSRKIEGGLAEAPITREGTASEADTFASGAPYGNDKGVGLALCHAPVEMESKGKVKDMWEAFRHLQRTHPQRIQSVEWFTFEDGMRREGWPTLIRIEPFDDTEHISRDKRKWPFLDYDTGQPRGALIMHIQADDRHFYVVEIQRMKRPKNDGSGEQNEESMSGLCFFLDGEASLERWIRTLLSTVRYTKGVFKELVGSCPGHAEIFAHSKSKDDLVPCEAAARNALRKLGVKL